MKFIKNIFRKFFRKESESFSSYSAKDNFESDDFFGKNVGYSFLERKYIGLCRNPLEFADIKEGETILDLASGSGIITFLASARTGPQGRVIGVDVNPDVIEEAGANAIKGGFHNVEFRRGNIESLPVKDNSVDLIISNNVLSLAVNKGILFAEIIRVLKKGGRIIFSDTVLKSQMQENIKNNYKGCATRAMLKNDLIYEIRKAGFHGIRVLGECPVPIELAEELSFTDGVPFESVENAVESLIGITVKGTKGRDGFESSHCNE